MAKWSAAVEQQKKEAAAKRETDRVAAGVATRLDVFKAFRVAGWEVAAVEPAPPTGTWKFRFLPDDVQRLDIEFRVKMPGAMEGRTRRFSDLLRLATGVGYGSN